MATNNHYPDASSQGFLSEGKDFYWENGLLVMTADYHRKRGSCCGNKCRWCPFEPKYELGAVKLGLDGSEPPA
jgi:hypothetical protein